MAHMVNTGQHLTYVICHYDIMGCDHSTLKARVPLRQIPAEKWQHLVGDCTV